MQARLLSYGDIILYTYPSETASHHIVIYLGGDRIFQAPETGQDVGYGTLSMFTGQTATVRRIAEP
jgi:cell wall-associated NlpC family hydrolase